MADLTEADAALDALLAKLGVTTPDDLLRLVAQYAARNPINATLTLLSWQQQLARPRQSERTYQQARGLTSGGEPAEVIQRRMRGNEPPGD